MQTSKDISKLNITDHLWGYSSWIPHKNTSDVENVSMSWCIHDTFGQPIQHWFRQWLVAWRHRAITWANVVPTARSPGVHSRLIRTWVLMTSIPKVCLIYTYLKSQPHLPRDSELIELTSRRSFVLHRSIFSVAAKASPIPAFIRYCKYKSAII